MSLPLAQVSRMQKQLKEEDRIRSLGPNEKETADAEVLPPPPALPTASTNKTRFAHVKSKLYQSRSLDHALMRTNGQTPAPNPAKVMHSGRRHVAAGAPKEEHKEQLQQQQVLAAGGERPASGPTHDPRPSHPQSDSTASSGSATISAPPAAAPSSTHAAPQPSQRQSHQPAASAHLRTASAGVTTTTTAVRYDSPTRASAAASASASSAHPPPHVIQSASLAESEASLAALKAAAEYYAKHPDKHPLFVTQTQQRAVELERRKRVGATTAVWGSALAAKAHAHPPAVDPFVPRQPHVSVAHAPTASQLAKVTRRGRRSRKEEEEMRRYMSFEQQMRIEEERAKEETLAQGSFLQRKEEAMLNELREQSTSAGTAGASKRHPAAAATAAAPGTPITPNTARSSVGAPPPSSADRARSASARRASHGQAHSQQQQHPPPHPPPHASADSLHTTPSKPFNFHTRHLTPSAWTTPNATSASASFSASGAATTIAGGGIGASGSRSASTERRHASPSPSRTTTMTTTLGSRSASKEPRPAPSIITAFGSVSSRSASKERLGSPAPMPNPYHMRNVSVPSPFTAVAPLTEEPPPMPMPPLDGDAGVVSSASSASPFDRVVGTDAAAHVPVRGRDRPDRVSEGHDPRALSPRRALLKRISARMVENIEAKRAVQAKLEAREKKKRRPASTTGPAAGAPNGKPRPGPSKSTPQPEASASSAQGGSVWRAKPLSTATLGRLSAKSAQQRALEQEQRKREEKQRAQRQQQQQQQQVQSARASQQESDRLAEQTLKARIRVLQEEADWLAEQQHKIEASRAAEASREKAHATHAPSAEWEEREGDHGWESKEQPQSRAPAAGHPLQAPGAGGATGRTSRSNSITASANLGGVREEEGEYAGEEDTVEWLDEDDQGLSEVSRSHGPSVSENNYDEFDNVGEAYGQEYSASVRPARGSRLGAHSTTAVAEEDEEEEGRLLLEEYTGDSAVVRRQLQDDLAGLTGAPAVVDGAAVTPQKAKAVSDDEPARSAASPPVQLPIRATEMVHASAQQQHADDDARAPPMDEVALREAHRVDEHGGKVAMATPHPPLPLPMTKISSHHPAAHDRATSVFDMPMTTMATTTAAALETPSAVPATPTPTTHDHAPLHSVLRVPSKNRPSTASPAAAAAAAAHMPLSPPRNVRFEDDDSRQARESAERAAVESRLLTPEAKQAAARRTDHVRLVEEESESEWEDEVGGLSSGGDPESNGGQQTSPSPAASIHTGGGVGSTSDPLDVITSPISAQATHLPLVYPSSHRVRISLSCQNLPISKAIGSVDSLVVVSSKQGAEFVPLGATEWTRNTRNPVFRTVFEFEHTPRVKQLIKFALYDVDQYTPGVLPNDLCRVGHVRLLLDHLVLPGQYLSNPLASRGATGEEVLVQGVGHERMYELQHEQPTRMAHIAGANMSFIYLSSSLEPGQDDPLRELEKEAVLTPVVVATPRSPMTMPGNPLVTSPPASRSLSPASTAAGTSGVAPAAAAGAVKHRHANFAPAIDTSKPSPSFDNRGGAGGAPATPLQSTAQSSPSLQLVSLLSASSPHSAHPSLVSPRLSPKSSTDRPTAADGGVSSSAPTSPTKLNHAVRTPFCDPEPILIDAAIASSVTAAVTSPARPAPVALSSTPTGAPLPTPFDESRENSTNAEHHHQRNLSAGLQMYPHESDQQQRPVVQFLFGDGDDDGATMTTTSATAVLATPFDSDSREHSYNRGQPRIVRSPSPPSMATNTTVGAGAAAAAGPSTPPQHAHISYGSGAASLHTRVHSNRGAFDLAALTLTQDTTPTPTGAAAAAAAVGSPERPTRRRLDLEPPISSPAYPNASPLSQKYTHAVLGGPASPAFSTAMLLADPKVLELLQGLPASKVSRASNFFGGLGSRVKPVTLKLVHLPSVSGQPHAANLAPHEWALQCDVPGSKKTLLERQFSLKSCHLTPGVTGGAFAAEPKLAKKHAPIADRCFSLVAGGSSGGGAGGEGSPGAFATNLDSPLTPLNSSSANGGPKSPRTPKSPSSSSRNGGHGGVSSPSHSVGGVGGGPDTPLDALAARTSLDVICNSASDCQQFVDALQTILARQRHRLEAERKSSSTSELRK